MPEIGKIKLAKEIGLKGAGQYIWHACVDCKKERWVIIVKELPKTTRCISCARKASPRLGPQSPHWVNGKTIATKGYIRIKLFPDDFFFPMANKSGYVFEHRLVVAKALNRCLLSWEIVHHRGVKYPLGSIENKQDNRYPENLELIKGYGRHNVAFERELKRQAKQIKILQSRVTLLEADNIRLESQIKEPNKTMAEE